MEVKPVGPGVRPPGSLVHLRPILLMGLWVGQLDFLNPGFFICKWVGTITAWGIFNED